MEQMNNFSGEGEKDVLKSELSANIELGTESATDVAMAGIKPEKMAALKAAGYDEGKLSQELRQHAELFAETTPVEEVVESLNKYIDNRLRSSLN